MTWSVGPKSFTINVPKANESLGDCIASSVLGAKYAAGQRWRYFLIVKI